MQDNSRNALCSCGSGKRRKHCCGAIQATRAGSTDSLRETMYAALARQTAGDLSGAEQLYQQALTIRPDEPDCLHMLGVIYLMSERYPEAFAAVLRALTLTDWSVPGMRRNLGLILARFSVRPDRQPLCDLRRRYLDFCLQRGNQSAVGEPLVSIIIPSYNHAPWIRETLESVYAQTYRHLELIVIDDGSCDGSPEIISNSLRACPFPHRFIARENRGAPATLNEAIALARGEYVNPLNSDDCFPPNRIEKMLAEVHGRNADWGFGGICAIDGRGEILDPAVDSQVGETLARYANIPKWVTIGEALLDFNLSISTGNLFARRAFFERLGGFRDFRYNHDWDFCLRSTFESEPVFVPEALYLYRMHGHNTIKESHEGALADTLRLVRNYFETALSGRSPANPFAVTPQSWGIPLLLNVVLNGWAECLPLHILQDLATRVQTLPPGDPDAECEEFFIPSPYATLNATLFRHLLDALPTQPLISVLLPVYNTPLYLLGRCIESVKRQIYPHWELCIADDASTQMEVFAFIERYASQDARIKTVRRPVNGHIAQASNSALALASGEYVALLDHDDELTPDALYCVAREIVSHPEAQVIYSDEDKIDLWGRCSQAYLKPEWNPELLQAQNCISHLGVYRTDLVRGLGGFRVGYEGAQDWDLTLRVTETVKPEQIRRIPRVLYHWRMTAGSTSMTMDAKDYARRAQLACLREHFERTGKPATLQSVGDFWQPRYKIPDPAPRVSIIVDGRALSTQKGLGALRRLLDETTYQNLQVVVCLDTDQLPVDWPPHFEVTAFPRGLGSGSLFRAALDLTSGEILVFLSKPLWPDHPDWVEILAGYAVLPEHGALAPKVLTPDGRVAFAGTLLGVGPTINLPYLGAARDAPGQFGRAQLAQNFQALAGGGVLAVARPKLLQISDVWASCQSATAMEMAISLGLRAAGYWNVWVPSAVLLTDQPQPLLPDTDELRKLAMHWPVAFQGDPAYHPGLSKGRLFEPA